nr:MAG TPA: hypothetical protein [Bacteriophage sp.]
MLSFLILHLQNWIKNMEEFYHTFYLNQLIKRFARFYFTSNCWIYTRYVG